MQYQINSTILTNVKFAIEAPEGLSKEELMEIIENTDLQLEYEENTRDEVKAMIYEVEIGNGCIYDEEDNELFV